MGSHLCEPIDVVHVVLELGDAHGRRRVQRRLEVVDRGVVARGERRLLARRLRHALGELLAELVDELRGHVAVGLRDRVHAVDDHAAERHPGLHQLAVEVDRLLDRVVLGRGDDQERRGRVLEQRADALGALREAVDQPGERAEEHRQVLEQVDAGHALEQREDDAGAAADDLAAEARGAQEDADRAALEEARQAAGRVEEVERVARRRRVEHEQVVVALLVELVELGDRRELLRAGDRARELLVDPVAEDLVARRGVGRELLDHLVEGALGVEHHRPQLALHLDPVGAEALGVDEPRLVAQLLHPERVGEALGGVDRDDRDPQPVGRHAHRERGRRGRLADAARAGADHDPLAVEQRDDRCHGPDNRGAPGRMAQRLRSGLRARRARRPGTGCVR